MLASTPASILNQKTPASGIPNSTESALSDHALTATDPEPPQREDFAVFFDNQMVVLWDHLAIAVPPAAPAIPSRLGTWWPRG